MCIQQTSVSEQPLLRENILDLKDLSNTIVFSHIYVQSRGVRLVRMCGISVFFQLDELVGTRYSTHSFGLTFVISQKNRIDMYTV